MLICENCPKVFHLKCIGLTVHPSDDFICPYCKGIKQSDCVKCFKQLLDINYFHHQRMQQNLLSPHKLQLLPAQCCLCLSKIHVECVDVPLKLLLKGGYYYDLKDKDYAELLEIYEKFK